MLFRFKKNKQPIPPNTFGPYYEKRDLEKQGYEESIMSRLDENKAPEQKLQDIKQNKKEYNQMPEVKQTGIKIVDRKADTSKNLLIIALIIAILVFGYLAYDNKFKPEVQQNTFITPQSNTTNIDNNNYTFSPQIEVNVYVNSTANIENVNVNTNST